jgi:hypothetical protein
MIRDARQALHSAGFARKGPRVDMPDDVQRVAYHEPCTFCGTARGCKHRLTA